MKIFVVMRYGEPERFFGDKERAEEWGKKQEWYTGFGITEWVEGEEIEGSQHWEYAGVKY